MRKISLFILMMFIVSGCSFFKSQVDNTDDEIEKIGVSESVKNGDMYTKVEVTKKGDKIVKVSIDEYGAQSFDGSMSGSKKELGDSYNMKAYSDIGKEWYEQIKALEDYIVLNGVDKIELDENGKVINTDLKANCTIAVDQYLTLVNEAENNIK